MPSFLILHSFIKSWVLFNISPSRDRIFVLLLTKSVSLCILSHILIGPSLNVFCAILKVQHLMASISLVVPLLLYMVLRMQIGQVVLMIKNLQVVTLFSLVRHLFHKSQASNTELLAPLLRLSIKP